MSVTLDDEKFLIRALSGDVGVSFGIPGTESERRRLIRSLMNMRGPMPASDDVLEVQDRYLSVCWRRRVSSTSTDSSSTMGSASGRGTSRA